MGNEDERQELDFTTIEGAFWRKSVWIQWMLKKWSLHKKLDKPSYQIKLCEVSFWTPSKITIKIELLVFTSIYAYYQDYFLNTKHKDALTSAVIS